jgi:benzodiazapine receptor
MEMVLFGVGAIFSLISFVCNIIILIHAFKTSVGEGFMCLCIPCYSLYYMFAKFEHEKKGLIIAGALGGGIIGNVMMQFAQASMNSGYGGGGYGGY